MATVTASVVYNKAAFTSAGTNGNARNVPIFAVEVAALALSEQPDAIYPSADDVRLDWGSAVPTAADILLIDAAVAAHAGGVTTGGFQKTPFIASTTRTDNATNNNIDDGGLTPPFIVDAIAGQLLSGLLVAGSYEVQTSVEINATDDDFANVRGVRATVHIDDGDGVYSERGRTEWYGSGWHKYHDSESYDVKDGEHINTVICFERTGSGPNDPSQRRTRIFLKRTGD